MSEQLSTLPCPFCAERIQAEATHCRFCQADIRAHLLLKRKVVRSQVSQATRELFALFGPERVSTYGTLRKRMTQTKKPLVEEANLRECEAAKQIIEHYGGQVTFVRARNSESAVSTVRPSTSRAVEAGSFLAALFALGISLYYYFEPTSTPEPLKAENASSQKIDINIKPDALELEKPIELTESKKEKALPDAPIHLKKLIAATAMLSGNGVTGSAFFIHPNGFLITNHHVIDTMTSIEVTTSNGQKYPATLLRKDKDSDLALIRVDGGGPFPTLRMGDATSLEVGETVWTIGAPHGLSFTVTKGIVSFVGRKIKGRAYVQADVAINPGNSGGPMINQKGEVIGINNFIISNAQGLNFAIPINYIYMGPHAISAGVLNLVEDNSVMASWREGEGASQSNDFSTAPNSPRPNSNLSGFNRIMKQVKEKQKGFLQSTNREQAEITRLQRSRNQAQQQAQSARSISEETRIQQRIGSLNQHILEKEILVLEQTIRFSSDAERLLNQARNMLQIESTRRAGIDAEIQKLRQAIRTAKAQITAKKDELRTEKQKVY